VKYNIHFKIHFTVWAVGNTSRDIWSDEHGLSRQNSRSYTCKSAAINSQKLACTLASWNVKTQQDICHGPVGFDTTHSGRRLPVFQRNMPPMSSWYVTQVGKLADYDKGVGDKSRSVPGMERMTLDLGLANKKCMAWRGTTTVKSNVPWDMTCCKSGRRLHMSWWDILPLSSRLNSKLSMQINCMASHPRRRYSSLSLSWEPEMSQDSNTFSTWPSLPWRWWSYVLLKDWYLSTRLHCIICLKMAV
jgi:hypothetical protein